jgi:uncharacterized membrane protein YkvA (DUF1232 family)
MAGSAPYLSKFFALAKQRIRRLLEDPEALVRLAKKVEDKTSESAAGALAGVSDELKALARLVRAYATGDYRQVSGESMAVVVGAVLYVVSPIDIIPDFLVGAGFLDDAGVLAFAYRKVHKEVEEFLEWERARDSGPDGPAQL